MQNRNIAYLISSNITKAIIKRTVAMCCINCKDQFHIDQLFYPSSQFEGKSSQFEGKIWI